MLKFPKQLNIPHKSGVYIFQDVQGRILYIGKAVDLYSRVNSYFSSCGQPKTAQLVKLIKEIKTIVVESELEALILEANLIKKNLPPFNVRLTDDKDFLYVKVTKEDYPRIETARKKDLGNSLRYFGPFPSSKTLKQTLKSLRKVFPWCAFKNQKTKPCFYYHLGLCPGVCIGKVNKQDYRKNIFRFIKFMEGKKEELIKELTLEMEGYSKNLEFESAEKTKKLITGIQYLTQPNRTKLYLENPNFLEMENQEALLQLQKILGLQKIPERIECYDISNIQGQDATGSMVVLTNGEIDTSQYRKFKIKTSVKPDDVGMHREMIRRRLNHTEWPYPDLFLIDGGRGQARAVKDELEIKKVETKVFGLAKRLEWLYPPEGEIVKLPRNSLPLKLLQKIRDEAHRFAISYHRKLRIKSFGLVYN